MFEALFRTAVAFVKTQQIIVANSIAASICIKKTFGFKTFGLKALQTQKFLNQPKSFDVNPKVLILTREFSGADGRGLYVGFWRLDNANVMLNQKFKYITCHQIFIAMNNLWVTTPTTKFTAQTVLSSTTYLIIWGTILDFPFAFSHLFGSFVRLFTSTKEQSLDFTLLFTL